MVIRPVSLAVALAMVLATTAGCSTLTDTLTSSFDDNPFSGDPYPIYVNTSTGAIIVGSQEAERPALRTTVLDVLSPITVFDRGADIPPAITPTTLTLFGARAPGGAPEVPRAQFPGQQLVTLHFCDLGTPTCEIGSPDNALGFNALVGADAFAGDALRLRVAANELFVFPDIAGDDLHRSRACDAVFPSALRGGGTLIIGGTELAFPNRRIAIDACLAPNPDPALPQRDRGVDALFVLSTAIGTSMINEATYARYQLLDPAIPALDALPEHILFLPSGPVVGRLTDLPSLALVGNLSSNPRAPCRQVYAHHLLAQRSCTTADDCPCSDTQTFCPVPAMVELAPPSRIPVLVVPDAEPTLQALRTELRPNRPEVDGILGTDVLQALELDIDYPNGRLLARCVDRQACGARITLVDNESRRTLRGCLGDMPGPFP